MSLLFDDSLEDPEKSETTIEETLKAELKQAQDMVESVVQELFSNRLMASFKLAESVRKRTSAGLVPDVLYRPEGADDSSPPTLLTEFKRPKRKIHWVQILTQFRLEVVAIISALKFLPDFFH